MWRPRLVALDVDGTLVNGSNEVAPEMRAAVQRVRDAGVPVILATGRSWQAASSVVEQLPLGREIHVCSNGAVLVAYPPFELVDVVTFNPDPVLRQVVAEHPSALLAVEVVGQGYRVTSQFPTGELQGSIEVVPADALVDGDVTRVIVRDPEASEEEFLDLAHRLGLDGVSYAVGYTAWLDIAPQGIDKAHGLAKVAERYGVDAADVLAIGDGRNDAEMLAWAGRGVALAEAPPEVQAAADHVTGGFAEHGTIAELDRWFG